MRFALKAIALAVFCAAALGGASAQERGLPEGRNIIVNLHPERGMTVMRPGQQISGEYCCTFENGVSCSANPCSQCNCDVNTVVIDVKSLTSE